MIRTLAACGSGLAHAVAPLVRRLVYETDAQDLVEYAFLAAFVATAGMIVLNNLSTDIASVYKSWLNPSSGVPSLWDPETSVVTSGS